jgi:hypothetical protein
MPSESPTSSTSHDVVQRRGDRRGVGGQADDRLAALARGDVGGRQATDLLFTMGGQDRALQRKTRAVFRQIVRRRNIIVENRRNAR